MKTFQTITNPSGSAEWHRRRKVLLLAEMRPVVEGESLGYPPEAPVRFDFVCDARMAGRVTTLGSAYGEGEPPTEGEVIKVNGINVRVLTVETVMSYSDRYIRYEIEIERAHV